MDHIVSKWGNSLGIRIPASLARLAGLTEGSGVRLSVRKGRLVIDPVAYDLETLMADVSPDNLHEAVKTGRPKGREIW